LLGRENQMHSVITVSRQRKRLTGWLFAFFGIAAFVCLADFASIAKAQELGGIGDELPDVGDRYEGRGMHFSRFWLLPTIEAGAFYDSKPDLSGSGGSSGGAYVAPNIEAKSDFGRHALNFNAGAEHYEYFEDDVEARTNFFGEADSRIDIRRDLVLTSGLRGGFFEDDQGKIISPLGAAEPVTYTTLDSWSRLTKIFNRLAVSADVAYQVADYEDVTMVGGGTLDQDFRDVNRYDVGGRAGYLFSPGYSVFVDAHYNDRTYDTGVNDSTGWRALSGISFEITRLLRGEASVGYMAQDYDTGVQVSDFSYHVGLIWNPTMLMTVKLDGDRVVGESSLAGSPGTIATSLKAAVDYEVLRTLIVTPFVGISFDEYIASAVEGRSLHAGIDADYSVNRFLSIGFDYKFEDVEYTGGGTGYERHIVGVNATAHF
jgi:hypothetical protein